jgi:2-polyprenyl-3-methyl-5-hydroxy-6-metoxy-1,4-benzoquinol methylase
MRKIFQKLKRARKRLQPQQRIGEFKTNFWQTDEGAKAFMEGSDAQKAPGAAVMNTVVNELFLGHCSPGAKVLDLGCGHGIVSIFLAKNGMRVTACDISELLLQTLRDNAAGLDIDIRAGDAHHIPAADEEFDVIVARMFLGHFPDWPKIVAEMARCCRPGGKLLLHFTSAENAALAEQNAKADCVFATTPDLSILRADPFRYFAEADGKQIEEVAKELGLRIAERAPTSFFLHNEIIGRSLGTERFDAYQKAFQEYLTDDSVKQFVVWFEKTVVQRLPVWASYYNILVLEKPVSRA